MTEIRDPYEVLGVTRGATRHQIRAAYLARARTAHPDLVGGHGLDAMRELNDAWAILKDATRRSEYDAASGEVSIEAFTAGGTSATGNDAAPDRPFWTGAMGSPPSTGGEPKLGVRLEVVRRAAGYIPQLRPVAGEPAVERFTARCAHV